MAKQTDVIKANLDILSDETIGKISTLVILDMQNQLIKKSKKNLVCDDNEFNLRQILTIMDLYNPIHEEVKGNYGQITNSFRSLLLRCMLELQKSKPSIGYIVDEFTGKENTNPPSFLKRCIGIGLSTMGAPGKESELAIEIARLKVDPIFKNLVCDKNIAK